MAGCTKRVLLCFRWKEAMDLKSTVYGCPMVGMIKYMPEVCQVCRHDILCNTPSGRRLFC